MNELSALVEQEPAGVIRDIAARDPFYKSNRERYFHVGQSALECVRIALLGARKNEVKSILDFASGYGRVTRTLRAAFPDADLTACDIKGDAIAFCAETFGATAVLSHEDPAKVELTGRFDLIWCGSLLTHVDSTRWEQFLHLLSSALAPGGVFVFTTAGSHVIDRMRAGEPSRLTDEQRISLIDDYERTGFGYRDYPDQSGLGLARCSPAWVCSQLERRPDLRLLVYFERGWNDRQDVVACVDDRGASD